MNKKIIITFITTLALVAYTALADTNISLLYGYNGSHWVPLTVDYKGKLQTDLNLTELIGFLPKDDNMHDLGSSSLRWNNLYVARSAYFAVVSGAVGIGTSSPISTLDISGNISVSGTTNSSIDGSTFYIDATNNRIGIGTTSPLNLLHVLGSGNITSHTVVGNLLSCDTTDTTANGTLICGSDNSFAGGGIGGWTISGSTLYNNTAGIRIGIATSTPTSTLEVSGNISVSGSLNSSIDSPTLSIDATNNRVGIGTTAPNTTLHVAGNVTVNGDILPNAQPTSGNTTQNITDINTSFIAIQGLTQSIAIGADGLPIIAVKRGSALDLAFIKCGNANCTSGNTFSLVDTTANVGRYVKVTIGTDGLPIMSYQDQTNGYLKVAKCGNIYCNASNTLANADSHLGTDESAISLRIGVDGMPVIAYQNATTATTGILRFAHCGNIYCNESNTLTTVDSTVALVGLDASVAIGADGMPIIAYKDQTNTDLKVAKCGNIYCNASNIINFVDQTSNVGDGAKIAIGQDGLPIIAYEDATSPYYTKVIKCGNIECSSGNTITSIDNMAGISAGWGLAFGIGQDGLPVLAEERDSGNLDLMVYKCGNAACSSGNTKTFFDTVGDQGKGVAMAIPSDNLPVMVYVNATNGGNPVLRVAKCAVPSCNQTTGGAFSYGSNLGSIGQFFNNIYGAKYWGRQFQIAAFDIAEEYQVLDLTIEAGDVVSSTGLTSIGKSSRPYDTQIVGVVSTDPAIRLGEWSEGNTKPITLNGRTPVKVTDENGPIYPGDLLTSSSKPGYAMKCPVETNEQKLKCFGAVIGKALEPLESGEGKIMVLVKR